MDKGIRNTLLGIFAFVAVIMGTFIYTMVSHHALNDAQYKKLGYFPFHPPKPIGAFNLVDGNDRPVGHDELMGQWSLMYFGYTHCPDVCPTTLSAIARGVKQLTRAPQVIMVSVDPERDTPAKLKAYLSSFNKSFIGYTGTHQQVVKLAQQVNIAFGKVNGPTPGSYEVNHSANIVVINPGGQYAGFIRPGPKPDNIARIMSNLMNVPLKGS